MKYTLALLCALSLMACGPAPNETGASPAPTENTENSGSDSTRPADGVTPEDNPNDSSPEPNPVLQNLTQNISGTIYTYTNSRAWLLCAIEANTNAAANTTFTQNLSDLDAAFTGDSEDEAQSTLRKVASDISVSGMFAPGCKLDPA